MCLVVVWRLLLGCLVLVVLFGFGGCLIVLFYLFLMLYAYRFGVVFGLFV